MAQSALKKRPGKLSARPAATHRKNKPATKGSKSIALPLLLSMTASLPHMEQ